MTNKKVLVIGRLGLLHVRYVESLKQATKFSNIHIILGRDSNIKLLKDIYLTYNKKEKLSRMNYLEQTNQPFLVSKSDRIDFIEDVKRIHPNIFIINENEAPK